MIERIKIIKVEVGKQPKMLAISKELKEYQRHVGGIIEIVYVEPGVFAIVNEEGRPLGLPYNRAVHQHKIVGPFFLAGIDSGEISNIPAESVEKFFGLLTLEEKIFDLTNDDEGIVFKEFLEGSWDRAGGCPPAEPGVDSRDGGMDGYGLGPHVGDGGDSDES